MNKRNLLVFICAVLAVLICSIGSVFAYADNTADSGVGTESSSGVDSGSGTESGGTGSTTTPEDVDFTVVFVHENKEYPMDKETDGTYSYESDTLKAKTLYKIEIKDKLGESVGTALLYKKSAGKVTVEYNKTDISMKVGSGDIYDTEFDFNKNKYYVSVNGGKLEGAEGSFAGCELSSFYFKKDDKVTVIATLEKEQGVVEWKNDKNHDYGKVDSFSFKVNESIALEAKVDYLPIQELLKSNTSITLKKDYEITEPIVLDEDKKYTVNLGGFDIIGKKSENGIFEINGASLTITGEGKIDSTGDKSGAIILKDGSLTLDGPTVLGEKYAVCVTDGSLTVKDGNFSGKTKSSAAIHFNTGSDAEALLTGGSFNRQYYGTADCPDTALSVLGGKITIDGGSFYGTTVIKTWGAKRDVRVITGYFMSESFKTDAKDFIDENSSIDGDATKGFEVIPKSPRFNIIILDGTLPNGYSSWDFEVGATVTVKPVGNADGMVFERWDILEGKIAIDNPKAKEITFLMPECNIVLKAMFKATDTVNIGTIDSDTLYIPNSDDNMGGNIQQQGQNTDVAGGMLATDAQTANKGSSAAGGSMAIIVLIIILVALLIAAIAVSVILIVRNYRIEREAIERAELGESIVDNLADQLSELDFGGAAGVGAATTAAGGFSKEKSANHTARAESAPKVGGIDFDKEMELGLTNTIVGIDTASEAQDLKKDDEIKLRRPKKPTQRPSKAPDASDE